MATIEAGGRAEPRWWFSADDAGERKCAGTQQGEPL